MAVQVRAIVEIVFDYDVVGTNPVDEFVFDEIAVGVVADLAFAGVAFQGGGEFGFDLRDCGGVELRSGGGYEDC